jgi:acyl-CoA thioesterase FadM
MNLYCRLIWLMLTLRFRAALPLMGESRVTMRVWPNDLDFNFHMNNGRYLTLLDLGRLDLMLRTKLWGLVRRKRWMPVVASVNARFRRALNPFQTFTMVTRTLGWDEKFIYLEQRFLDGQERLMFHAIVKAAFVGPGGTVPTDEIMAAMDEPMVSRVLPDAVQAWATAERALADSVATG